MISSSMSSILQQCSVGPGVRWWIISTSTHFWVFCWADSILGEFPRGVYRALFCLGAYILPKAWWFVCTVRVPWHLFILLGCREADNSNHINSYTSIVTPSHTWLLLQNVNRVYVSWLLGPVCVSIVSMAILIEFDLWSASHDCSSVTFRGPHLVIHDYRMKLQEKRK